MLSVRRHFSRRVKMGNQQPSLFEGTKVCNRCETEKPITAFRLYKGQKRSGERYDRRSWLCVECERQYNYDYHRRTYDKDAQNLKMREWRKENPEAARSNGRKWAKITRDKHKDSVYTAYGNKCVCCGETEPLFLTIDHVNNDGNIERKLNSQGNLYSRIISAGFPDTFQILCWNCNTGKMRNNGVCPHQEGSTVIPKGSSPKQGEASRTQ
jgi:hypothetical protein